MNNFEFYKKKIEKIEKTSSVALVNNKPVYCAGLHCEECQRHILGGACSVVKFIDWANEEYKEPKINLPEDITVDTPILVSDNGKVWEKRHFAKFGMISTVGAWTEGKTSYTADDKKDIAYWYYAKLPDKK